MVDFSRIMGQARLLYLILQEKSRFQNCLALNILKNRKCNIFAVFKLFRDTFKRVSTILVKVPQQSASHSEGEFWKMSEWSQQAIM